VKRRIPTPAATPPPTPTPRARWLLLAHQLPTRPSNARVKTWRRLQQIGAVPTRNSVYVLPNTDECREDFEWMRTEIITLGGDATVFAADALDRDGDAHIIATVQRMRDEDYRLLKRDVDRLRPAPRAARAAASRHDEASRVVRQLRERLDAIRRVDYFDAPAGPAVIEAIAALERRVAPTASATEEVTMPVRSREFTKRRWVTRPRPGVDRMASAWLIRRFIDPKATFAFVERPAASDVPFDMYTGDFSHQGPLCTFEVLAQRFAIADPAVARLAQIVHDLDMKETRYGTPEAPAVERMVDGLRQVHRDDAVLLEQGIVMFEALARSFESSQSAPTRQRPKR
jgi:hypothetical protein